MKHLILAALAASLPILASAQMMPDSTVQVCAYWSKGDRVAYECKITEYRIGADSTKTTTKSSSETRIFEVLEETDTSYVLQTSYKDVFSSDMSLGIGADLTNKLGESVVIRTLTNEFGAVKGILNPEELAETMKQQAPLIVDGICAKYDKKELEESGMDLQELVRNVTEVFGNEQYIMNLCGQDVYPLFFYHGTRLDMDGEYTMKYEFPNLIPGSELTLETDLYFWVDKEQSDSTFVVIRSCADLDNEALKPVVRENILNALKLTGVTEDTMSHEELMAVLDQYMEEAQMQMSVKYDTAIQIHLATGWPTYYWSERRILATTKLGTAEQVEEQEISYAKE